VPTGGCAAARNGRCRAPERRLGVRFVALFSDARYASAKSAPSALRQPLARDARAHPLRRSHGRLAVWPAPRRARPACARMVRVMRSRTRADAAVLAGRRLGRLTYRPAYDQEQRDDRDLQQEHQPDEGPRIHSCRWYTRAPTPTSVASASDGPTDDRRAASESHMRFYEAIAAVYTSYVPLLSARENEDRSSRWRPREAQATRPTRPNLTLRRPRCAQATLLNCVISCSSSARASICSRASACTRSVPNCSTLNDASTVA
jgi:hypothetical protein